MKKSKGEREAEFTKEIVKMEKDYLGRGPLDARTFFIKDMVVVRLQGVLTPAEERLTGSPEGKVLVRDARRQLFETSRSQIESLVEEILSTSLVDMFSDISIDSGERVIVLTVAQDLGAA
jgi:uncharacterized protein YbcI